MSELGGVWLQAKSFIPVIVPPLTFADLKAVWWHSGPEDRR
jgi:hypothetical protein